MQIFIIGASITQGFDDVEQGGWCNQLFKHAVGQTTNFSLRPDAFVFNLGVSGDTTTRALGRIDAEISARILDADEGEKSVVIFSLGVNDSLVELSTGKNLVSLEVYRENISALYTRALKYSSRIIFIGITPVDEYKTNPVPWATDYAYLSAEIAKYDACVRKFALERETGFIPMQDVFAGHNLPDMLTDGVHPNAEGHRLMFERVREYLEKENIL